jgi:flavin reductase (DIM6/NTAB) family NADH-FMN oxidoreductase RutF
MNKIKNSSMFLLWAGAAISIAEIYTGGIIAPLGLAKGLAAEKEGRVNTMTASWGGLGVIWSRNVAYVVIRPQRYTKEFIDASDTLSLSFYDEAYRNKLNYLGAVSGRDEDKIAKAGLTRVDCEGVPYFDEANLVLICRKLYAQELKPECFIDKSLDGKYYPDKDYHTMFIVEIVKALMEE